MSKVLTLLFLFYQEMVFQDFTPEYSECPVVNYQTCNGIRTNKTDIMLYNKPGINVVRVGIFVDNRIRSASMGFLVNGQVSILNKSLAKSGANIFVEVAFVQPIDIQSYFSGDMVELYYSFEDWRYNYPFAEYADLVYENRADFVHLFLDNKSDWNACGVAKKFNGENYPVGITACYSKSDAAEWDPDQAVSTEHVFAHELGHQFGLDHDAANAAGKPLIRNGYGYMDEDRLGTIMSYGKIRMPYYSNPALQIEGIKYGNNSANSVRALNEVAPTLSRNFENNLDGNSSVGIRSFSIPYSTKDAEPDYIID